MIKCDTCKYMMIEQHESYLGSMSMYYYGPCSKGCDKIPRCECDSYEEGEPTNKDCRVKGEW